MGRRERITRELKSYDRELYCAEDGAGRLCVLRETLRAEIHHLDGGDRLISLRPAPYLVFHLTHNWRPQGTPVDWGLEPIMKHVRECDLWKRDVVADLEKQEDEHIKKMEREGDNQREAFLYDFHSQFKETFNDVNTANLDKRDLRKTKEKSKWGL